MNQRYSILTIILNLSIIYGAFAQADCCSALRTDDFSFTQYCIKGVNPCNAGTSPCNQAGFEALFGPFTWGAFQCLVESSGCGTGACEGGDVLPVSLKSFGTSISNNGITILWATETEINNEGFHVERSRDGLNWDALTFMDGFGTSVSTKQYEFLDEKPLLGANYYRLRQVDFDGGMEYSPVTVALWNGTRDNPQLAVMPNPAQDWITPILPPDFGVFDELIFEIYDMRGQMVQSTVKKLAISGGIRIDLIGLEAGNYVLKVYQDALSYNTRFIKIGK